MAVVNHCEQRNLVIYSVKNNNMKSSQNVSTQMKQTNIDKEEIIIHGVFICIFLGKESFKIQ